MDNLFRQIHGLHAGVREAVNANWLVRELKRQIDRCLFERLLLSRGAVNKEQRPGRR